ncbi:MAG: hypothetical protein J7L16_09585 [Deltaproteobacteria bacterium]|nr:hypothetical protein [Deltaproteobacteria bacterium]
MDGIRAVSKAGNKPPLSCMNDGLQAAAGASLGRGAIQITDTIISLPPGFHIRVTN